MHHTSCHDQRRLDARLVLDLSKPETDALTQQHWCQAGDYVVRLFVFSLFLSTLTSLLQIRKATSPEVKRHIMFVVCVVAAIRVHELQCIEDSRTGLLFLHVDPDKKVRLHLSCDYSIYLSTLVSLSE